MDGRRKAIPADSLLQLRQRLDRLPPKSPERATQIAGIAELYGLSSTSVYRALAQFQKPHAAHRADHGKPRILEQPELERYCELIAALKLRTTNKHGRHLSTRRAIELLEEYGVETVPRVGQGAQRAAEPTNRQPLPGALASWISRTCDGSRRCALSGGAQQRLLAVRHVAVRPEAYRPTGDWVDPAKGDADADALFSVVDDRSGVTISRIPLRLRRRRGVGPTLPVQRHGTEARCRLSPFQGRPKMIYLDNGPVAKSRVFQNVMQALAIPWETHIPAGKDGTRTTARSKGKVERPFRTVKEAHETLYHFHKPETEQQANEWLMRYLLRYNDQGHRSEAHSRRSMTGWPTCLRRGYAACVPGSSFAVSPASPSGAKWALMPGSAWTARQYEVEPEMAGDYVVLLWGLFDEELYVEYDGERTGPYYPISGPIPLHRYRAFKRGKADERAGRIRALADQLGLPISALSGDEVRLTPPAETAAIAAPSLRCRSP
jgi:hypothetical protein